MGYRIEWAFMADYIRAFRGLLRGEVVEWEGAEMQMLHPEGHAPQRPVDVPVLISALGPMGAEVARDLGDGLFATLQLPGFAREFPTVSYLAWGTVLDEGEDPTGERVRRAGGPGTALAWHGAYEFAGQAAVADLPGGEAGTTWSTGRPRTAGHLAVHTGHCVELNDADRAAWDAGGHGLLEPRTLAGPRSRSGPSSASWRTAASPRSSTSPADPTSAASSSGFFDAAMAS